MEFRLHPVFRISAVPFSEKARKAKRHHTFIDADDNDSSNVPGHLCYDGGSFFLIMFVKIRYNVLTEDYMLESWMVKNCGPIKDKNKRKLLPVCTMPAAAAVVLRLCVCVCVPPPRPPKQDAPSSLPLALPLTPLRIVSTHPVFSS